MLRVITVEDNSDISLLYDLILRQNDLDVVSIDQYDAAILSTEEWASFDVMLVDWAMPEYSGDRIIDLARTANPNLKVIVVSAFSPDTIQNIPDDVEWLVKNSIFDGDSLLKKVRE